MRRNGSSSSNYHTRLRLQDEVNVCKEKGECEFPSLQSCGQFYQYKMEPNRAYGEVAPQNAKPNQKQARLSFLVVGERIPGLNQFFHSRAQRKKKEHSMLRGIADNIACCTVALAQEPTQLRQYPQVGAANCVDRCSFLQRESYSLSGDTTVQIRWLAQYMLSCSSTI